MPVALVVEDNRDMLGFMSLALRLAGWVVMSAEDAPTALKLTSRTRPDIAITDFAMPGRNGLDLARDLRLQPGLEGLPVVVVTGQPTALHGHQRNGALPGVCAVLTKPITQQQLEDIARFAQLCGEGEGAGSRRR